MGTPRFFTTAHLSKLGRGREGVEEADKDFPLGATGGSLRVALSSSQNPPFDPENRAFLVETHLLSRELVGLC